MRYLIPLAVLLLAQIGAAWAIGETNVARPGASFTTVETETAAACERLCADDTICMAWSFRGSTCELKATVPAAVQETGAISGLSARAPASMRTRIAMPAPAPSVAPIIADEGQAAPISAPEDEVTMALLGGPEGDEGLRSRLGN